MPIFISATYRCLTFFRYLTYTFLEVITMAINNTLRQLRLEIGLTQEQVAEKLNVTRQAISSYESGRTRPDIDTLMRFAEIYETDLDGILYGNTRKLKALRNVKIVAFVLLALTVLLILTFSVLKWSATYFFPILNDPALIFRDQHIRLVESAEFMEGLAFTLSSPGMIVIMFFVLVPKCKIHIKYKLLYVVIFILLLYAASLPFAIADPVFDNINYTLTPARIAVRLVIFLIFETVIELIINKRSQ